MTVPYPYIVNEAISVPAVFHSSSGTLRATLPPQIYDRKLNGVAIDGPAGTTFALYRNAVTVENRFDGTLRGQSNTADYPKPRPLGRGVSIIAVWTKGGLTVNDTANATFFVERA